MNPPASRGSMRARQESRFLLRVRLARFNGSGSTSLTSFIDDLMPEAAMSLAAGGYGQTWGMKAQDVPDSEGIVVYECFFPNSSGRFRVEVYVK